MNTKRLSALFEIVVLLALVMTTLWTSREFLAHGARVLGYLVAPKTATISSDEELNDHLARYITDSGYTVHLVQGEGFSLSPELRRTTIQRLGTVSLRDQLDFGEHESLPEAVNAYLIDRLTLLGRGLDETPRRNWAALVHGVESALGRRSIPDYIEARMRAHRFLETQRLPEGILKAQRIFTTYEVAPNPSDLTFFVGVDPDPAVFQTLIMSATSRSPARSFSKVLRLRTIAGDKEFGDVRAQVTKVFCDARFLRPWFPEHLLDDGIPLPTDMTVEHYGEEGALRVVPTAMVLFVGVDVVFEVAADATELQAAVETGRCCELQSPEFSVRLASNSVRKVGESRYRGRSEPDDPRLVALISRRRAP